MMHNGDTLRTPLDLTSEIVAAYVRNNPLPTADLPSLVRAVHSALIGSPEIKTTEPQAPQIPAVPVKKSVTPNYIICLEDGRKFKTLKRHLKAAYGMTPEQYREKWGLPEDYPMVASNYSTTRSTLAKGMGLGRIRTEVEVLDVRGPRT
jgi:predicted transcriptional regulator